jgi:hypothetical protein
MKPVRYAILPALAVLLFGIGGTARADSVGLAFWPGGIYYFDYNSGYRQYGGYRHEYERRHNDRRHAYEGPSWVRPPYWHGYRSYGYSYRPPVRRFYGHDHDHDRYWHGERGWGH